MDRSRIGAPVGSVEADQSKILRLPARLTAGHRSAYRNGVVWHAWERADAKLTEATRKERYWVREYRDAYREAFGPLGDPTLLGKCSRSVADLLGLVRDGGSTADIARSTDLAARLILAAIRSDPDGAPDLTDLMEELADALTERPDTQFCVPHVLTALALLWAKDGEIEPGMELLESTIYELNEALKAEVDPALVSRNLALAYCAKSDLHRSDEESEARLLATRMAWWRVQMADATYKHFVIGRYRKVLEDQQHADEVIQAATLLERRLADQTIEPVDWIIDEFIWSNL